MIAVKTIEATLLAVRFTSVTPVAVKLIGLRLKILRLIAADLIAVR